jgi:hypothetical protein
MKMNGSNDHTTGLVQKNTDERALVIKRLTAVSGRQAEDALMVIAGAEGDQAALELIKRLNAIELGQIIKQFDMSIPSTTAWLADPVGISVMLAMDPMDWEEITAPEDILRIQSEALNLLATILLTTDNELRQEQILEAIVANDASFFYLCLPFIGHDAVLEKVEKIYFDSTNTDIDLGAEDDTDIPWDLSYRQLLLDLYLVIENHAPAITERIKAMLVLHDESESPWQAVKTHVLELRQTALISLQSPAQEEEEEFEDMFDKPPTKKND